MFYIHDFGKVELYNKKHALIKSIEIKQFSLKVQYLPIYGMYVNSTRETGVLSNILFIVTRVVSNIGKAKSNVGTSRVAKILVSLPLNSKDKIDSMRPIKRLPLSPIKIFAGLKLNTKNPKHAPNSDIETMKIVSLF